MMKQVDLEEPTPLLDQVQSWSAHSVNASRTLKVVQNKKNWFDSLVSASTIKQVFDWDGSYADIIAWSYEVGRHAKKCV